MVQVSQRDEGAQKKLVRVSGEPYGTMKPSSDRSVKACTEGGSTVGGWVGGWGGRQPGLGRKGSGDGGGLGEGTVVARADRDVSAASVISRRLAAARGHRGAHESIGMIEQTTLTTLAGGRAVWTNQSGKK